jgi:flagellar hook protein FlgE
MSIRGSGFFVMRGSYNGVSSDFYTRDGRFGLDSSGSIVNPQGLRLQGYMINPSTGLASPAASDLRLDSLSPPIATSNVAMSVNLDSRLEPPAEAWDPENAAATSNYSTSVTVYDSLGNEHRVDLYFINNGDGSWEWHALVDGASIEGGDPGSPVEIASGGLNYNSDGALDVELQDFSSVDFVGAAPGQIIDFDFGDAIADGGTGLSGSTQFATASTVTGLSQNGVPPGTLMGITVESNGTVRAEYSNGRQVAVARVALASFRNTDGLRREGDQLYSASHESGDALVGEAGSGGRGALQGRALEGSNVDLGNELVTLIAYQRAFQANARTVTTADEILSETNNLKR